MQKQTITLKVVGANDMNAYVASPDSQGKYAAVIIFQEAFGVNGHIKQVTDKLAAEGYIGIAPELFHRTAPPGFEASYTDFESVRSHIGVLTTDNLIQDIRAVFEWLLQNAQVTNNNIAAIGFCLGGRVAFLANATIALAASVSYYGGAIQTIAEKAKDTRAPQLFFWGGLDRHILPEHIETTIKEMKAAGKEYINTVFSYADHGFNCDEKPAYNRKAASEAWALTLTFLKNNFQ
jgi:carboxymethylenebutenolidase